MDPQIKFGLLCGLIGGLSVLLIIPFLPSKKCPDCKKKLPKLRNSLKKAASGGFICPHCGCEIDRNGKKITQNGLEFEKNESNISKNTSGQGKNAIIPPEIKGWNWGAFFLNFFWSIGNRVYIGLLAIIPCINIIILIILGIYGNKWAWQNRKWDSIEHFRTVQKSWAKWGLVCFIVINAIVLLLAVLFG